MKLIIFIILIILKLSISNKNILDNDSNHFDWKSLIPKNLRNIFGIKSNVKSSSDDHIENNLEINEKDESIDNISGLESSVQEIQLNVANEADIQISIDSLLNILDSEPDNFEVNRLLGMLFIKINKLNLAENFLYNSAVISNWTDFVSIVNLAETLRINEDVNLSEKVLLKGLISKNLQHNANETSEIMTLLGTLNSIKGNYSAASEWYLKAVNFDSSNIKAWIRASTIEYPSNYQSVDTALNLLYQANSAIPNNPLILFNLGKALYLNRNIEEAILVFESVNLLATDMLELNSALATAYHSAGDFQRAIMYYEISHQQSPYNLVLLTNYAILLCSVNMKSKANELLSQVNTADSASAEVVNAMKMCTDEIIN